MARHGSEPFTCINTLNAHRNSLSVGAILISIVQIRKLTFVQSLTYGPASSKRQSQFSGPWGREACGPPTGPCCLPEGEERGRTQPPSDTRA